MAEVLPNNTSNNPSTHNNSSNNSPQSSARDELKKLINEKSNKLTEKEHIFLSSLVNVGTKEDILHASVKINDDNLFFKNEEEDEDEVGGRRGLLLKSKSKLERLSSQRRLNSVSTRRKSIVHDQLWKAHQDGGISLGNNGSTRKSMSVRRSSLLASNSAIIGGRRSSIKQQTRGSISYNRGSIALQSSTTFAPNNSKKSISILKNDTNNIEEDEDFLIEQAASCFGIANHNNVLNANESRNDNEKEQTNNNNDARTEKTTNSYSKGSADSIRSRPMMMRQASQGDGMEISLGNSFSSSSNCSALEGSFTSFNSSSLGLSRRRMSSLPTLVERSSSFDDLVKLDKNEEKGLDEYITGNTDNNNDKDSSAISHNAWLALDDSCCLGYGGGGEDELDFLILGTDGNDETSKPHVLSPPLMDSLFGFLPFSVTEQNYWLKFSLVRDGASLMTKLQNIRGSKHTLVAIESVDGDVFGSFTSDTWKKTYGFYGSGEAFLWKMKQNRLQSYCTSILDQAMLESELEVFPWSGRNRMVQFCQHNRIGLGGGAINDTDDENNDGNNTENKDVGSFGLVLEDNLLHGSSGPCATFNNPCLAPSSPNGVFEVANLEVWTLTPYVTEDDAEKNEFSMLFMMDNIMKKQ